MNLILNYFLKEYYRRIMYVQLCYRVPLDEIYLTKFLTSLYVPEWVIEM
jgi:hypothetical protein